jgi:hypothetical protein
MTFYLPSQSPLEWRKLLADPVHWKPGFSARTLAHSWQTANGFPPEVRTTLAQGFGEIEPLIAIPEHKVPIPGKGAASQTDLWVLARAGDELVSIAVEGKVSEPFGPTVDEWLRQSSENKKFRLDALHSLLGCVAPLSGSIRYQLLHRSASAILEAKRFRARHAVLLVHSFSKDRDWFGDFEAFGEAIGTTPTTDRLIPIWDRDGVKFWVAWVCGDLRHLTAIDPSELEAARQAVFQKVGHLVLRLQHIEGLLKYLLNVCRFDGPIGEFKKRLASETNQYSRKTLGELVGELPDKLIDTKLAQSRSPAESAEAWFTFSFGFEQGNAFVTDWAERLKSIKNERNDLVHHFLGRHYLQTLDACAKASAELDAQRERTLEPYQFLLSMVQSIKQHFGDIQAGRVRFTEQTGTGRQPH